MGGLGTRPPDPAARWQVTEFEYGVLVIGPTFDGGWATRVFECDNEEDARNRAILNSRANPNDRAMVVRSGCGPLAVYVDGVEVPRD